MGRVSREIEVGSRRCLDPDRRNKNSPFPPSTEHGPERRKVLFAVKLCFAVVVEGGSVRSEFFRGIFDTRSHIQRKKMMIDVDRCWKKAFSCSSTAF